MQEEPLILIIQKNLLLFPQKRRPNFKPNSISQIKKLKSLPNDSKTLVFLLILKNAIFFFPILHTFFFSFSPLHLFNIFALVTHQKKRSHIFFLNNQKKKKKTELYPNLIYLKLARRSLDLFNQYSTSSFSGPITTFFSFLFFSYLPVIFSLLSHLFATLVIYPRPSSLYYLALLLYFLLLQQRTITILLFFFNSSSTVFLYCCSLFKLLRINLSIFSSSYFLKFFSSLFFILY
mmetsp:Transcript_17853/g.21874  ORF Transcript_17853/g.21874 Transcript_17853/m.21874 type:complete len:234 (+) Transcript_17853:1312-2013(+)